mmetsp:Transcript_16150/g.49059  ORF Transcript_16150/g.49059 Transcript_16150/m.49059 type:complete len:101 (-) Transcript_16150:369-671(-)
MLPSDVLETVLIASDCPELAGRLASVSKLCRSASESDLVWQALCRKRFPKAVLRLARPGTSWKAFFRSRCVVHKWRLHGGIWRRTAVIVRARHESKTMLG